MGVIRLAHVAQDATKPRAKARARCGSALPSAFADRLPGRFRAASGPSNILEKAKSDDDLKSLRGDADFEAAVRAATGTLVGPRTEPETAAAGVKLLPAAFLKVPDRNGVYDDGFVHYKPALLKFWTWRPDDTTELLVGTVVHDPSTLGQPKGDSNQDYGGLVVLRRVEGKLTLLESMKTGEVPPAMSAGRNKRVIFTLDDYSGSVKGTLAWNGSKVVVTKESCPE